MVGGAAVLGGMAGAAAGYVVKSGVNSMLGSGGSGSAPADFTPASTGAQYFAQQSAGRTHILRTTIANRQIIYGQAMVSGPLVFAHSGDNYGTLHLVIALAGHECEEIGDVWFNDESLGALDANGSPTSGRFYLPVNGSGAIVEGHDINQPAVNGQVWAYVTLGQHVYDVDSVTDSDGYTWTRTGWDGVAATMGKNNPGDPGLGTIPYRQFGVQGDVIKLSPYVGRVTVTYRTASGTQSYYARIRHHLGATDQAADSMLVGLGEGWTSAHRLRGVAYIVTSMVWDQDRYPRGIPNVKAVVKGKKLYDPRTGLTVWSDNPALVARDYLTAAAGLGCTSAEIDDASFITAANVCDALVTIDAAGTTQKRYTCNGVVDVGQRPTDILQAIVSSCGGMLVWQGGKWIMHAGAYSAPVGATLTADDLRGPIKVSARVARSDLFNAIKGTFVDPARGWLPQDYPIQRNSAYVAADGGEEIVRDLTLPMTTSNIMAQRIAKLAMDRARQGIVVQWPGVPALLDVCIGDTKAITLPHLGWSAKEFRVIDWTLSETGAVDLVLQEEASGSYDWNYGQATAIDTAPDTNLVSPFAAPAAPGTPIIAENLYETSGSAGVRSLVRASWFASASPYIVDYILDHRASGQSSWTTLPGMTGLSADIFDLPPGPHDFRVKARNAMGVTSPWSATATVTILGLTAPPADPTGFYLIAVDGGYEAEWTLSADLDVKIGGRAVIRHSTLTSGATWNDGIIVKEVAGDAVGVRVPLMAGTYLLKFKDSSGNWSENAAAFVPSEALLTGYTTVATSTQHPAFAGAKSNTALVDATLRLDSASTIGSMTTPISAWPKIASLGGIVAAGSYAFDAAMDLTTVAARRFDASITALSFDTGDFISFRGLVSEWDSVAGNVINDCDATLYIRTTDDDPAGTPAWGTWTPFFVGEFNCRAAQFRLDLASGSPTHNIAVSALSARARIPA